MCVINFVGCHHEKISLNILIKRTESRAVPRRIDNKNLQFWITKLGEKEF